MGFYDDYSAALQDFYDKQKQGLQTLANDPKTYFQNVGDGLNQQAGWNAFANAPNQVLGQPGSPGYAANAANYVASGLPSPMGAGAMPPSSNMPQMAQAAVARPQAPVGLLQAAGLPDNVMTMKPINGNDGISGVYDKDGKITKPLPDYPSGTGPQPQQDMYHPPVLRGPGQPSLGQIVGDNVPGFNRRADWAVVTKPHPEQVPTTYVEGLGNIPTEMLDNWSQLSKGNQGGISDALANPYFPKGTHDVFVNMPHGAQANKSFLEMLGEGVQPGDRIFPMAESQMGSSRQLNSPLAQKAVGSNLPPHTGNKFIPGDQFGAFLKSLSTSQ